MLCDKCKQREAKIYYTEIVGGQKKEQHLCEECAAECSSFQFGSTLFSQETPWGNLLSSLLGNYKTDGKKEEKTEEKLKCSTCGMTYQEFLKVGKFGCTDCYKNFYSMLPRNFKSIQGADTHTGKRPNGFTSKSEQIVKEMSDIDRLTMKLQDAIEKEEFEEAARLRDEIRSLKKEGQKEEGKSGKEEINNA